MLAGHAVFSKTIAINHLFTKEAVALHRVLIALAAAHPVLTETDHADFRT